MPRQYSGYFLEGELQGFCILLYSRTLPTSRKQARYRWLEVKKKWRDGPSALRIYYLAQYNHNLAESPSYFLTLSYRLSYRLHFVIFHVMREV
jgi:hypothetical protein